jgi:hypothetical protein
MGKASGVDHRGSADLFVAIVAVALEDAPGSGQGTRRDPPPGLMQKSKTTGPPGLLH